MESKTSTRAAARQSWSAWAPSLNHRRPADDAFDGSSSSSIGVALSIPVDKARRPAWPWSRRRLALLAAFGGGCFAFFFLAWHLFKPRIVVSSSWRWLRNHGPFPPVLHTPPATAYLRDGHTPDWACLLAPPILRKQTVHVRKEEIQAGIHVVHSVVKPTLLTGADTVLPAHFHGMVYPFECMFAHMPRRYMHRPMLVRLNDVWTPAPYPVLSKARAFGDRNAVLIPIDYYRFFNAEFLRLVEDGDSDTPTGAAKGLDVPFREKEARAVWRGATTNAGWRPGVPAPSNTRRALIERWWGGGSGNGTDGTEGRVDVGLSVVLGEAEPPEIAEHWRPFVKPKLSAAEQLRHRYLISVEGNDVATGLRWMLASRSVVLMVPPTREIWSMESLLQPWVHYLPLKPDFSDILERMDWCEAHLDACEDISKRARRYVRGFNDSLVACKHGAARLREYLDKVTVVVH